MNKDTNFAKHAVIEFFAERNAKAGTPLQWGPFLFQVETSWNPKQKDALEHALIELVKEGILEGTETSFLLSKKGENEIY